jgi:hypothetical protein
MKKRVFGFFLFTLLFAVSLCAQSKIDEPGIRSPRAEELAASKRLHDLLQKPDFITLRLAYNYLERPTDTPQSYKVKDSISFQLLMTQSLSETIVIEQSRDPFRSTRTELFRDGDHVAYSKAAQWRIDRDDNQPPEGSAAPLTLLPGRESGQTAIRLENWYEPLAPGHYQLSVRKRFVWDGEWIQSNALTFEVEARTPAALPDSLRIEIMPGGGLEERIRRPYSLRNDVLIRVMAVNNSDRRIKVEVADNFYGDRPQLLRQGQLIPYSSEAEKVCRLKEEHASSVGQASNFFLEPNTTTQLGEFSLTTWYGPLPTGSYRLVNRRRFEIDGPWTSDSAELLFEIVR